MNAITMTAYRRPDYTREVLAALARCEGVGDWVLHAQVEPGHDAVIQQFRQWDHCEVRLVVNLERMGLNRNTHAVLTRAFASGARTIIHLEDDTVPSPDALSYFRWAVESVLTREESQQRLLASGYNKPNRKPPPRESHHCRTRPVWTPWGWAVDSSRLDWLLRNWCFKNPKCFTCHFRDTWRQSLTEVFPVLSRIQNIGYELGENNRTPEWYRANHRTPWVAGKDAQGAFRLDTLVTKG